MREIPHLALKTICAGTARLGPFLGLLGPWGVTDKRSFALVCRRIALWCWCHSRRADATCHARQLTNHETARCSRTKRNVLGVSIEAQILRSPLWCVARVATVGSKPLLQLTAGTERACGSVWLVIRPQAKIRVRALSCVHITSQGPRPSLCRVHTVILGGGVGY